MKTLKNKLLVALVIAFAVTLGAAIIPTVGMQVKAAGKDSFQITLTDGIAVKYYATLGADVTEATATFTSETEALNATVKGEKSDDKWVFTYNEVTPQYVDATFSVKIGEETKVENYSVLEYLNTIINGKYAAEYKTVAKDLVYYGEAAKAFKLGGKVAAQPGTAYAGGSKMSLTEKFDENTRIYSATVVFDTLPAIRFGFKKASEAATVTVDGEDVTNALVKGEDGVYTYTVAGIYAVDFDTQYAVVLTDGDKPQTLKYSINDYAARMQNSENEAMKTLAKSLYCYGAGAQALKTYQEAYVVVTDPTYTEKGVAKNSKGEEITLPILNATNYTYSQVAADGTEYKYNNGQGGTATFTHKTHSEIVIEKEITADTITINWKDYNNVDVNWLVASRNSNKMTGAYVDGTYVLTILKGTEFEFNTFRSLNSNSKADVKITGNGSMSVKGESFAFKNVVIDNISLSHNKGTLNVESILVNGENADVTIKGGTLSSVMVKNGKLSFSSAVEADSLSVTESANVSVTGELKSKVLVDGTLTVTGKLTSTGDLSVKAGTLTIDNQLIIPANATLEVLEGATLNVTNSSGDVVRLGSDAEGVTANLYGTVKIAYTGTKAATGLWLGAGSVVNLGEQSRVTIEGASYSIFAQKANNDNSTPTVTLYYPSDATKNEKDITSNDNKLITWDKIITRVAFTAKA